MSKPAMRVSLGNRGLSKTWQKDFPEETTCCWCKAPARIGFVAHEGIDDDGGGRDAVCHLHENGEENMLWLHDYCAVAVYFCTRCLKPTAFYNQG